MSRDPQATALRHAVRHGVPHVHRDGPLVVVVIDGRQDPITGRIEAQCLQRMCSSAGIARAVAARVLDVAEQFPGRDPLATAELYAEAALRHARRRRGA